MEPQPLSLLHGLDSVTAHNDIWPLGSDRGEPLVGHLPVRAVIEVQQGDVHPPDAIPVPGCTVTGIVVEVTELEPGATFAYRPVSGPLRTHNIYTFEITAGGTQITLTDEIELTGIFGLLEPLMARMVRRQYQSNLAKLKTILEAQPAREA